MHCSRLVGNFKGIKEISFPIIVFLHQRERYLTIKEQKKKKKKTENINGCKNSYLWILYRITIVKRNSHWYWVLFFSKITNLRSDFITYNFPRIAILQAILEWILLNVQHYLTKSLWISLTLSRRRFLSYRNKSIDLQSKSMDWFLYDRNLRHERVKPFQADYSFPPRLKMLEKPLIFWRCL